MAFLHLEALGSNRSLAIVFQTELRHSAKFLGQFSHNLLVEYFDVIKGVLREGQEAGVFRADISITIAAHCFFGAVDEIVTTWILSDRDRDSDYHLSSLTDSVVAIVLQGVETGS
jgi:TetR/AcrR family fatty acid metabolism transcriptional regulator